jgi:putative ABC transport system permease protein
MEIRPILSAMGRNKFGALLIAGQMALTLGFLVNALCLVEARLSWTSRPTGTDEANLFAIQSEVLDHPPDLAARVTTDLKTLRELPGVVDAFVVNSFPLGGGGWTSSVNLHPDQRTPSALTAVYFADEHGLHTLGARLIAGRDFTADEITDRTENDNGEPSVLIVTKALADKLFPAGNALGQSIYVQTDSKPERIVGIIERLQAPFTNSTGPETSMVEHSVIGPYRPIGEYCVYLVRAKPGSLAAVMKAAERHLLDIDGNRILRSKSLSQRRAEAYRGDRGLVVLLVSVCAALLTVTAFGIIGLTSYWVTERRQQIGIRRALVATRGAIVRYFQTENLMIASAGAAAGVGLALALNLWMVRSFDMVRMDNGVAVGGAIIMLILGQLAVLWPALRAASIPPALATRGG